MTIAPRRVCTAHHSRQTVGGAHPTRLRFARDDKKGQSASLGMIRNEALEVSWP